MLDDLLDCNVPQFQVDQSFDSVFLVRNLHQRRSSVIFHIERETNLSDSLKTRLFLVDELLDCVQLLSFCDFVSQHLSVGFIVEVEFFSYAFDFLARLLFVIATSDDLA